jgi:DNA replication protein DnaC
LEYRDAKIDCVPEPLRAQLLQWLDDQQRPWCLVLLGAVGVGKTYSAAALACEWARRGYTPDLPPARFVSVPVLIQELRDDALVAPEKRQHGDSGIPAVAWASSLTVLDDLGTQRNTDFAIERLYLVIDGRYARRLPTIVTTNLALGTIAERIDPRLASRLVAGVVLRLSGPDRRLNRRADGS